MSNVKWAIILIALLLISGCQTEQYEKIDAKESFIIVVNLIDKSLSFINEETREEAARWEMPFAFIGATVLPDHQTLLLYGKHLQEVYLYNLEEGKNVGKWDVGKGIANVEISKDQRYLYLANQETDTIMIMTMEGEKINEIPVGADPLTMLESEKTKLLYILNFDDPAISVIDLNTNQLIKTFPAKKASVGAVMVESRGELWIGGHGIGDQVENAVTVYSTVTGEILGEIKTPVMPVDLEIVNEEVFVVSHGSNELRKIDKNTKEIESVVEIGANPFEISIFNGLIYSASYDSNELIIVEPTTMEIIDSLKTGQGPFQVLYKRGVNND